MIVQTFSLSPYGVADFPFRTSPAVLGPLVLFSYLSFSPQPNNVEGNEEMQESLVDSVLSCEVLLSMLRMLHSSWFPKLTGGNGRPWHTPSPPLLTSGWHIEHSGGNEFS